MTKNGALKVTASTGNVFRDLGFSKEKSEHLLIRADLLIQLQKAVAARGLKQAEAAKVLRVTQPRVSDLLRGRDQRQLILPGIAPVVAIEYRGRLRCESGMKPARIRMDTCDNRLDRAAMSTQKAATKLRS